MTSARSAPVIRGYDRDSDDPIRFAPPALAPSSQVEIEMSIAVAFR